MIGWVKKKQFPAISKPRTSTPAKGHRIFPYLLRVREIRAPNEVWWAKTSDTTFCLEALDEALSTARKPPEIFNTNQGAQFTAEAGSGCRSSNEHGRARQVAGQPLHGAALANLQA